MHVESTIGAAAVAFEESVMARSTAHPALHVTLKAHGYVWLAGEAL